MEDRRYRRRSRRLFVSAFLQNRNAAYEDQTRNFRNYKSRRASRIFPVATKH